MSARMMRIPASMFAIALAVAAMACEANEPDADSVGPASPAVASAAPAEAASAPSAAVAGADPAQQAINDEIARADLAADIEKRVAKARAEFGSAVPLRVESGLFVIYAAERGVPFDAAADFAQRALDVYLGSYFERRPDRAVSVELVRSTSAFIKRCGARFEGACEGALGAYSRKTREILVNVGPGLPTISHELIHPLVQTDFPRIRAWFDEGIGALFEKPVFDPPGEMHGVDNWRYEVLARTLRSADRAKLSLSPWLFATNSESLYGSDRDEIYSEARAFCQWLDERGQLWPFYRAWRENVADDSSGMRSFEQVTGFTTLEEADVAWRDWAKTRRWR